MSTSKALVVMVIVVGLVALAAGLDPSRNQIIAYGLTLAGAIYNRLDSRRQGYKFSLALGAASATVEAPAEKGGHNDPA